LVFKESMVQRLNGPPHLPLVAGPSLAEAGAEKALVAERQLAAVRLAVVAHGTLVYHFLMDKAGTAPAAAYSILALAWLYTLALLFFPPYRRVSPIVSSYIISIADSIAITLWIYATGGFESPFYVILYGSLVAIAFRYSYRETVLAAVVYSALYLSMLAYVGELAGHLPDIAVRVGYVFLIAAIGALAANEAFRQACARLELRDLAERLRHEVAERLHTESELAEAQRGLGESREAERLHLAQELHDGPVQDLYGARFQLKELHEELGSRAARRLAEVQETLQQVIRTLRTICGELRPPALAPFGLEVALRSYLEQFHRSHPELDVRFDVTPDGQSLPEPVRLALFRICQEALNNIAQHAQARTAWVTLALDDENVELQIQDDGRGLDLPVRWLDQARRGHLGLLGARERAEAIGGRLEVAAVHGEGTVLRVTAPRAAQGPGADGAPAEALAPMPSGKQRT
jgi:signal transduction histidine kinase